MSEKSLDDVLRYMRMAVTYLQGAEDRAEQLMHDHSVAMLIHKNIYDFKDTISYLDYEYRQSHYGKK